MAKNKFIGGKAISAGHLFTTIGVAAIIIGGLLAATTAKEPTTFALWASAYLVLVVGLAQIGIGLSVARLVRSAARLSLAWALALFSLGHIMVIMSGAVKYNITETSVDSSTFAYGGGLLILASLALLVYVTRRGKSNGYRALLYGIAILLAVCVPIGLILHQS